jgi:hypothetical protein
MADAIPDSRRIDSVAAAEEIPFVWSLMGKDAVQPLCEILLRKEAERKIGGTFWWGLGTSLGPRLELAAIANKGTLTALFSRPTGRQGEQASNQIIYLWKGWRSIRTGRYGTIPEHVVVLGGDPAKNYYALVCRSDAEVRLGDHGPFDPSQCLTVAKGKTPGSSQRSALLTSQIENFSGRYRVAFRVELVDHVVCEANGQSATYCR